MPRMPSRARSRMPLAHSRALSSSPSASGPSMPVTINRPGGAIISAPIRLRALLILLEALPEKNVATSVSKAAALMPNKLLSSSLASKASIKNYPRKFHGFCILILARYRLMRYVPPTATFKQTIEVLFMPSKQLSLYHRETRLQPNHS